MGSIPRVMTKNHLWRLLEPLWRMRAYLKLVTNLFSFFFFCLVFVCRFSLWICNVFDGFLQNLRVHWLMKNTWLWTMLMFCQILKLREPEQFKWCVFLFLITFSMFLIIYVFLLAILSWFFQMELSKSVGEMKLDDAGSDNEDEGSDSDAWVVL